jgi:Pentapeptide repeats (8 copies)
MANDEHVAMLKKGVKPWNAWRDENPQVGVDLIGANLSGANLSGANLGGADLLRLLRDQSLGLGLHRPYNVASGRGALTPRCRPLFLAAPS